MKRFIAIILHIFVALYAAGHAKSADVQNSELKDSVKLKEINVLGNSFDREHQMLTSQNTVVADKGFLETNFSGSLMQSLASIPGVKAMNIGSGQSKPAIRGLGFNRMVVTDNGIKHESQQWGDDHGLEIDQFAIDRVEVIKGPAALLYGSDAIGGVINLHSDDKPSKPFEGNVNLFGRSNNASLGMSLGLAGNKNKFYYKLNATAINYGDYKVPADSIQYYSYYIKLKNRELRNTAGREYDGRLLLGYDGGDFHTYFNISDSYSKAGFFANAHGLEVRLSDIDYDKSRRDIDLPYFSVNHLLVANKTTWRIGSVNLSGDIAYQNNNRRELSEPVSHGYMPTPPNSLERQFTKNTYTANFGLQTLAADRHNIRGGIDMEFQDNQRGGWGFIIPDFSTFTAGAYVFDRYHLTDNFILSAGVRYDHARTSISSYYDWYKTPVEGQDSVFKQRSADMTRNFDSFTWSAGINYETGGWVLKANIGKSFRIPIPKELGSDGINYHIFRYEKGNSALSPEESYQLDAGILWGNDDFDVQFTPYINYFPNYIYMNPTPDYYEGLQVYYYTQSRVLRYGFEAEVKYRFLNSFEAELQGEYLYARQKSGEKKGYTLPFTPPMSASASLKYSFPERVKGYVSATWRVVGAQNEIVPPESPTPGYNLFDMSIGKTFDFGGYELDTTLHGENLLGKRYFDHTSYYRLIGVPEPGRNFSLIVSLKF